MWFVVEWQTGLIDMWRETCERVGFVDEMKIAVRRHGGRVLAIVRLK